MPYPQRLLLQQLLQHVNLMANRYKELEENLLRGVNLKADATKLVPGYFTKLQNYIPSKKYKIKKKRGVELLTAISGELGPRGVTFPRACGAGGTPGDGAEPGLVFECVECPNGLFAQADYIFDENNFVPGGPAIRIKDDSTPDETYGLGAIYSRIDELVVLTLWDYETLDDIALIIDCGVYDNPFSVTLNDGDTLRIETDASNPLIYNVKRNDSIIIQYDDSSINLIDSTANCYGFIFPGTVTIPPP